MIVRRDTSSRRERIVTLLREQNSVQIPALAEIFGVSTQTLRKDLNFLDAKGVCTRSFGGALLRLGALSPTEEVSTLSAGVTPLRKCASAWPQRP